MATSIELDNVSSSWDEHSVSSDHHDLTAQIQVVAQAAPAEQSAPAQTAPASADPVPVDVGGGAPAAAPPAANAPHEYVADASNVVRLPANVSIDNIKVDGHNLVLEQADGSVIVIKDGALNVPTFILGEVEVPRVALIAALEASHVDVAFGADGSISAGPGGSTSSAGGNFEQPAGGIGDGFGLSALLPPTDLHFGQPDHRELFAGLVEKPNHAPEIEVTPTHPNPLDGNNVVDESGLPVIGSNPSDAAIHATGTIHMTDPDGAGDLKTVTVSLEGSTQTVNINAITGANSQTFDFTSGGAHGTLTISGYNAATGNATYTYTLTTPETGANGVDPTPDTFTLTVTDASDATGTAILSIDIVDDHPIAAPDTNSLISGQTVGADVESNDKAGA
ncbi:hypothetical protein, partial [Mesorhizobium sp. ES1-4]|uniref:hypothetical protein n=1 Tax=Mesorhizobium sp. ES1-4 TaxID=2876627 RepID=UPI001CCB0CEA